MITLNVLIGFALGIASWGYAKLVSPFAPAKASVNEACETRLENDMSTIHLKENHIADRVLFPGEADDLISAAVKLVVQHSITVPMLIEAMQQAAEFRDRGIGCRHVAAAVSRWCKPVGVKAPQPCPKQGEPGYKPKPKASPPPPPKKPRQ